MFKEFLLLHLVFRRYSSRLNQMFCYILMKSYVYLLFDERAKNSRKFLHQDVVWNRGESNSEMCISYLLQSQT